MGRNQKRQILTVCVALIVNLTYAQSVKHELQTSLSLGAGQLMISASTGVTHQLRFGVQKQFALYYGLRYSLYSENKTEYTLQNKCDCRLVVNPAEKTNQSLNIMIGAQYHYRQWFAGFNIDLAGIKLGEESAVIEQIQNSGTIHRSAVANGKLNLLKVGYNDEGFLNSEFYIGYQWSRFALKAALAHVYIQYTPAENQSQINDAEIFYNLGTLGISYRLYAFGESGK